MKREDIISQLECILGAVLCYSDLKDEILEITDGSGRIGLFIKHFVKRLIILSQKGKNAISCGYKLFERIDSELYSMIFLEDELNIRILYAFLPNGEPVLLMAFYERSGKRHTDYTIPKTIAMQRLNEIKEGQKNG